MIIQNSFLEYIIKRILKSVVTLVIITLVVFFISAKGKVNPIKNKVNSLFYNKEISVTEKNKIIEQFVKSSHTNLPLFYLSIEPVFFNDSLFSIYNPKEQAFVQHLNYEFKNWTSVIAYHKSLTQFVALINANTISNINTLNNTNAIFDFENALDFKRLNNELLKIDTSNVIFYAQNKQALLDVINKSNTLLMLNNNANSFVPSLHFYPKNQFHYWLFGSNNEAGLLQGNLGKSIRNGESINTIIIRNLKWSLFFSIASLLISLFISILIGLLIASIKSKIKYELSLKIILFLYSIPNFCICILCVTFLSSNHFLNLFPSSGLSFSVTDTDVTLTDIIPHLILPLLCYCYVSALFLTQYLATIANKEYDTDYVRTAYAKGASPKSIILNHILKNCAVPLIQIIGLLFPYLVGGSVIIETFFTLPGVGYQTVQAILNYDYTLLSALVFISTVFTLTIYLITDICIALIDKRIILDTNV
jgi:peptide/nickel transport system permease protein